MTVIIVKIKRFVFVAVIFCFVCLLTFVVAPVNNILPTSLINDRDIEIIIDAGHGGFDGGAVADDGTEEKTLNLQIALKLNEFCNAFGYKTLLVRDDDFAINTIGDNIRTKKVSDMKNRLELMKKYPNALYVSIHMNKYTDSSPHGAQVFYSQKKEASKTLAIFVQSAIIEYVQKDNTRKVKSGNKDIFLLDNATSPTIIAECGFLSNKNDLELLKNEAYQQKLSFAVFLGINRYFNNC